MRNKKRLPLCPITPSKDDYENKFLHKIISFLQDYLNSKISAKNMISKYENLICEEFPWDTKNPKLHAIDEFHTDLTLYEEDKIERDKHPIDYYGPEQLKTKAQEMLNKLRS